MKIVGLKGNQESSNIIEQEKPLRLLFLRKNQSAGHTIDLFDQTLVNKLQDNNPVITESN